MYVAVRYPKWMYCLRFGFEMCDSRMGLSLRTEKHCTANEMESEMLTVQRFCILEIRILVALTLFGFQKSKT